MPEELQKFIELASDAYSLYQGADPAKERRLLRIVTSNRRTTTKTLDFVYAAPFREVAAREKDDDGRPSKKMGLAVLPLLDRLVKIFSEGFELDLSGLD